jgi:hypothetical protein
MQQYKKIDAIAGSRVTARRITGSGAELAIPMQNETNVRVISFSMQQRS